MHMQMYQPAPPPGRPAGISASAGKGGYDGKGGDGSYYGKGGKGMMPGGAKDQLMYQQRRTIDYSGTVIRLLQDRVSEQRAPDEQYVLPTPAGTLEMMPPCGYPHAPITSLCTKFVHVSTNKRRFPVNCVLWTPDGRRLLTGAQNGEFTLWNGQSYNFDSAVMAHEGNAIRCMTWNHNEKWLVTGDDSGTIKFWQSNLNPMKTLAAHREKEPVRGLSFSPTDLKFCSCSDDTTVKVWDFKRCVAEATLTEHGNDVKACHWHPIKSLIASGSKDGLSKLWDPRAGRCIASLHGHKNTVSALKWNINGNWLLTGSRDFLCKVFDVRMLKALDTFIGQHKEVTSVCWHPAHEELFCSGGADGSILHWIVGYPKPQAEARGAHEGPVWSIDYHPLGHVLTSGSQDCSTKFWCRNRPGEIPRDGGARGHAPLEGASARPEDTTPPPVDPASHTQRMAIPGIGLGHLPPSLPPQPAGSGGGPRSASPAMGAATQGGPPQPPSWGGGAPSHAMPPPQHQAHHPGRHGGGPAQPPGAPPGMPLHMSADAGAGGGMGSSMAPHAPGGMPMGMPPTGLPPSSAPHSMQPMMPGMMHQMPPMSMGMPPSVGQPIASGSGGPPPQPLGHFGGGKGKGGMDGFQQQWGGNKGNAPPQMGYKGDKGGRKSGGKGGKNGGMKGGHVGPGGKGGPGKGGPPGHIGMKRPHDFS